jgi:uncharacterized flavoprotein (TIGR03862 family)
VDLFMDKAQLAIVGGGPAGLMAAEVLSAAGHAVTVYDAMPSLGRKFLLAGKSGLNLTHAEEHAQLRSRFGEAEGALRLALDAFDAAAVVRWAEGLGIETFVGTSGRVFPRVMKTSPLLRAWLARLQDQGVRFKTRHRCCGFAGQELVFDTPSGRVTAGHDAVLLALGGASWPRLGADGSWIPWLREAGVQVHDFRPANCGFDVDWSPVFRERFAGGAVKAVTAESAVGVVPGEFVITQTGMEGGLVYAHAACLRDQLAAEGVAYLVLDLAPQRSMERLEHDLLRQGSKVSLANRLRKVAGLEGVKAALVREVFPEAAAASPDELARMLKALPITVVRPRPLAEAISSAGGVAWSSVDANGMLTARPGVFVAGEMLDWEAPTGGYLLTACFATGVAAAAGMERWLP